MSGNRVNSGKAKVKTMLIPSQAIEGSGTMEGVETRRVSPNNNLAHERPTTKVDKTYQVVYGCNMGKPWTSEDDAFIRDNYAYVGVKKCAEYLTRTPGSVANRACRLGYGRMKGSTLQTRIRRGYIEVYIGSYRAPLHRLLGEMLIGRKLREDEVIHHRNEDTMDNRLENLEVVSRGEHQRLHWGANCDTRRDSKTGKFTGVDDIVRPHGKP